jgi:hypothetical protein
MMKFSSAIFAAVSVIGLSSAAIAADGQWQQQVAQAMGKPGVEMPGGIYRVALPRTDLAVMLDGVRLKPGFALGGWIAFSKMGNAGMAMGDVVLTDTEVNPVMQKLLESGIEITALHNHLLRNQPFTMYMHVLGHGDPAKLAAAFHAALALSATPLIAAPAGTSESPALDLDTAAIDTALGAKGKNAGGVYQFGIPRAKPIIEAGMQIPPAMGTAIGINFQPTGGGKAAITGDFVLTANEVNPVAKALREHGIEVTAIHNHMLGEQPRLFFLHFWANADAVKLAQGLKAALVHVDVRKG